MIKKVLEERLRYIGTFIRFKKIDLHADLQKIILPFDERKLVLIIDNILSNAIKFSKQGGRIEIVLNQDYLSIKDHGVGIAKENQKKIFKRFETSNGFGVGLDIVSELCKEHHIRITVESELSKGSKFKLIWPKK